MINKFYFLSIVGVFLTFLFISGCSTTGQIKEEIKIIDQKLEKAKQQNAMKLGCGPKELGLAEAHREFTSIELSQGDWRQAKYHVTQSRKYANLALKLSKPCEIVDNDGDGILNQHDKCIDIPEDLDQFEDEDGCPDADNDKDNVCDPWVAEKSQLEQYKDTCSGIDKCPNAAETKNGFEDEDGCPDYDKDGDGIFDENDKCPENPEDIDGFEDEDGCPDVDNDKDGVLDEFDKCPLIPEDIDGFEDEEGCPDADNDKDGICDPWVNKKGLADGYKDICTGSDLCPNDAEDKDSFEDEDGCPDADNDKDAVCDSWVSEQAASERYKDICEGIDKCPLEPENKNNYEDEDGCPEEEPKKYTLIEIKEDKIELKQKIFFEFNKAKIKGKGSFDLLDQIVDALLTRKNIKIKIEGHTDDKGNDAYNKKLSQSRADAVKDYLASKGVSEDRLESIGYGEEKPIASNKTEKGREMNRRVEFNIVKD